MTTPRDLDDILTAWLADEAPAREPDGLALVALARTRRTRQTTSMGLLERWLPMELTLRRPTLAMPLRLLAIVLALLLLLVAAMSVPFLIGSPSLPATVVGEVRNGLVAFGENDISVADPDTGERRVLIGSPEYEDVPRWSPDGSRLAFWRSAHWNDPATLMVANADGSSVRPLTGTPTANAEGFAWSPDGTRLVMSSTIRGYPSISIVGAAGDADGGPDAQVLDLGFPAYTPSWHPDGHRLLVRAGTPQGTTLLTVSVPDGLVGEPILRSDTTSAFYAGDRGINDLLDARYTPDGQRIVYVQGEASRTGGTAPSMRVHVANADGTGDRVIEHSPDSLTEQQPSVSPDGSRLALVASDGVMDQVVVMGLDDASTVYQGAPYENEGSVTFLAWSPDGTQLLTGLYGGPEPFRVVDVRTGEAVIAPWLSEATWPDWQRISVAP